MVVEPEEAYDHATEICRLHQTVYSQPFRMPVSPPLKQKLGSMPSSPVKSMAMWSHGMEPSSEAMSEYPLEDDDLKVSFSRTRNLRSSCRNSCVTHLSSDHRSSRTGRSANICSTT